MNAASTWAEQRIYNELAVRALEHDNHPLAKQARARFDALLGPQAPSTAGYSPVPQPTAPILFPTIGIQLQLDKTGGISSLKDTQAGIEWALSAQPLAQFVYKTYNDTDWVPFTYDYINGHGMSGGTRACFPFFFGLLSKLIFPTKANAERQVLDTIMCCIYIYIYLPLPAVR